MSRLWGKSIAAMSGAYSACAVTCWTHGRGQKMPPAKLQLSIKSYDGSIPFPSWLLRVAGNQCIDALRRQRRGRQVIVDVEHGATVVEAASAEPSPLGAVMRKEEKAQARDAIAGLPEDER